MASDPVPTEHEGVRLPLVAKLKELGWDEADIQFAPEWRVPKPPSEASKRERAAPSRELIARSSSLPHREVRQARALLAAGDGVANEEVARRFGSSPKSVRRWRSRFETGGVESVGKIASGRGRKPEIDAAKVEAIVTDTLSTVPDDGSVAWTTRSMAQRHSVGKDTVARIWKARKIRSWKADTFKLSTDPDFEAKVIDVVGLYLNPPEAAAVFAFDEKTQIQALDRTQPSLPMKPGRAGTLPHDYKRNGTIDLFAAMNLATGEVLHDTRKTRTGADVLAFFTLIDLHVPKGQEIHVVLDNLSAHKSVPVRNVSRGMRQVLMRIG